MGRNTAFRLSSGPHNGHPEQPLCMKGYDDFKGRWKPAPGKKDLLLDAQVLEALLELGELTATFQKPVDAGPRRMRLGIDFQIERLAGLPPGRAGLETRTVGHDDVDL